MQPVKQHGSKDCGVACVAMLAGVPYERAYAALYGWEKPWAATFPEMKRALRRLGIRTSRKRQSVFGQPERYLSEDFDALLYANYRDAAHEAHWIVWDSKRKRYLDPLKVPYKRPRVHSYVKVIR